jgi:hypothetical protein
VEQVRFLLAQQLEPSSVFSLILSGRVATVRPGAPSIAAPDEMVIATALSHGGLLASKNFPTLICGYTNDKNASNADVYMVDIPKDIEFLAELFESIIKYREDDQELLFFRKINSTGGFSHLQQLDSLIQQAHALTWLPLEDANAPFFRKHAREKRRPRATTNYINEHLNFAKKKKGFSLRRK